jgi:flagellar hook assembly protein FlgD
VAETAPGRPRIERIYPNPMRGAATIEFVLPRSTPVRVEIVDLSGRVVRRLTNAFHPAGAHRITWDGRDGAGGRVASGLYFVRLAAGSSPATARIVKLD